MKMLKYILIGAFLLIVGIAIGVDLESLYPSVGTHSVRWYYLDIGQYIIYLLFISVILIANNKEKP